MMWDYQIFTMLARQAKTLEELSAKILEYGHSSYINSNGELMTGMIDRFGYTAFSAVMVNGKIKCTMY